MDERSNRERQRLERERRAQDRAERQLQLELQRRNEQFQRLRENLEREMRDDVRQTEFALGQEPEILLDIGDREEDIGLHDREPEEVSQEDSKMDFAGAFVLQSDERDNRGRNLTQYDIDGDTGYSVFDMQSMRGQRENAFDSEKVKETTGRKQNTERNIETDQGEDYIEQLRRRLSFDEEDSVSYRLPQPTPTFLKRRDSLIDAPKSILKKKSSTPIYPQQLDVREKILLQENRQTTGFFQDSQRTRSKDREPTEKSVKIESDDLQDRKRQAGEIESGNPDESSEEKMLARIKSLQLQAERMAKKSRQRLSEEDDLRGRIKMMDQKKKETMEKEKRQKNFFLIKQEEERLEKILRQRMEEEALQKRKLAELYKKEEEMRKEMEGEDRKVNLVLEEEESMRQLEEDRYDSFKRGQSQKEVPLVLPKDREEQNSRQFLNPNYLDDLNWRNEQRSQNQKEVKQETVSHQQKQLYNEEERRKMIEYIKELESRLMERNEAVDVRDRQTRLAQDEELRRKDLYTKERLKLQTDFEEIDQYRAILAVRESELQQKENSLKQIEEELQRKQDDFKQKYNIEPQTEVIQDDKTSEKRFQEDRKETANEPVVKTEVTHFVKPFVNGFSGADPIPKNESSFEEWKLETQYLINSKVYPEYIINQAIRNSLRGQARKVLVTLGPKATSTEIRQKIESLFGNVASGESVLQEFYNAMQKSNESVPAWGIRIEEIFQKAKEKGHVTDAQKDKMLKNKFWLGLRNTELKNASRVHYEKEKVDFELLRTKVRTIELEMTQDKSISQEEVKRDVKIDKEEKDKDKGNSSKIEVQHQPAQESTTKLLTDLMRKMEVIEKRMDNINRNPGRPFFRGRGRGTRVNPQPSTNRVETSNTAPKETTEPKAPLNG